MNLFDSHAHFDLKKITERGVAEMLERAWSRGLVGIIAIAGSTEPGDFGPTFELVGNDPRLWVATGIHPHTASAASPSQLEKLRFALDRERVVALGEIGLDYHYNHSSPAEQRAAFIRQIRMAHDARLPVIIHTREADRDTIAILRDEGADEIGGVIHCFSSTEELASQALELGFYLSFSGIVTFPKAREIQQVAAQTPDDRLLAETDTPFLSPVPLRGRVNEPANVFHVVEKLGQLKQRSTEEMAELTMQNTRRCFGLPETEE